MRLLKPNFYLFACGQNCKPAHIISEPFISLSLRVLPLTLSAFLYVTPSEFFASEDAFFVLFCFLLFAPHQSVREGKGPSSAAGGTQHFCGVKVHSQWLLVWHAWGTVHPPVCSTSSHLLIFLLYAAVWKWIHCLQFPSVSRFLSVSRLWLPQAVTFWEPGLS